MLPHSRLRTSNFLPPFPRGGFASRPSPRPQPHRGNMKAVTPADLHPTTFDTPWPDSLRGPSAHGRDPWAPTPSSGVPSNGKKAWTKGKSAPASSTVIEGMHISAIYPEAALILPLCPMGAERVGVRWGAPVPRCGDAHLTLIWRIDDAPPDRREHARAERGARNGSPPSLPVSGVSGRRGQIP